MTKTLWEWEADWIRLVASIKEVGIKVDKEFCKPKIIQGEGILQGIRNELGWNPASTTQLGKFLIEDMGFPVLERTDKGNPSFNKHVMEEYDELLEASGSDVAKKVLRYRGWQKTVSSNYKPYIELCDRDRILHPNYKVHGTVTGRLSCELPNLQQIPRESEKEWNGDIKRAFIPRPSCILVEFDYGQLETRLAAAVAQESELLSAFWDKVDVFQVMADRLGWIRQDAKLLTYMMLYGAGVKKVSYVFKLDKKEARNMIEDYFSSYPNLRKKATEASYIASRLKYIEYWTGRRRHFKNPEDYHKAFNAFIQGGAFEIVKRSGIRLAEKCPQWPIVLTVHDSYVLEMPEEEYTQDNLEYVKGILESVPESEEMGVPFAVEYKKWGEK